jgi:UDP-N-acetylmuramoyl-tripeptide--D-alanyl-D-alanine ligase
VAKAKWEIIDGLKNIGTVIGNGESPYTYNYQGKCNLVTFGFHSDCDIHPSSIELLDDSIRCDISTPSGPIQTSIPGSSRADILNALASVACVINVSVVSASFLEKLTLDEISEALRTIPSTPGRLQKIIRDSGIEVIFDGYNSNPLSLANSLDMLAFRKRLSNREAIGRRVAILGDMLELGDESEIYHRDAGRLVSDLKIDLLITVGKLAGLMNASVKGIKNMPFETTADCANELHRILKKGDLVLIKASRLLEFEKLLDTGW